MKKNLSSLKKEIPRGSLWSHVPGTEKTAYILWDVREGEPPHNNRKPCSYLGNDDVILIIEVFSAKTPRATWERWARFIGPDGPGFIDTEWFLDMGPDTPPTLRRIDTP